MKTKHLQIGRAGRYMLLLLMLPLMAAKAYAYDFSAVCSTGQTLYYNITDNGNHLVELTCPGTPYYPWDGYTKPTGNITIPSTVTYNDVAYTVAAIGDYAFYYCNGLTGSLTIPDSVTEIGGFAFYGCSGFTGSLTIPNSVTEIGGSAFVGCSGFTGSLTIPNSVTYIGEYAFAFCGFTGSLTIPNSVTYIGGGAFAGCSGFTGSLTIPNSVTYIGGSAFDGCSGFTGSLTIPNSVTYIGGFAFYGCYGFTGSLTIPDSVTSIGEYAFDGCSGFTGSLTIPNSVTYIGRNTFYGCSGFTGSLTIPNSVTYIGWYAFEGCSGFTGSLTIPDSVTEIGMYAFAHCSGFTGSLTIPNSVTEIGDYAFAYCTNLQFLQVEAFNPPIIENNTFEDVNKAIPVTVPCGSLSAYQTAPYWSEFTNIQEDFFFTLSVSSANDDMGSATITQQPDCFNDVAIVTATPNPSFIFVNWTKNGEVVSTEATYTFTLTENTVLVANFRQGTGVEENDAASSANFAYISNGELVISCEGKNTLHIFDMMGRMLSSQTINGDCRISANRMTAGTYILNLNGMAQKIVVK